MPSPGIDSSSLREFPLHWILVWSVAVVLAASGYKYLIAHNYSFLVEAACDTQSDCYVRNCEEEYCPPNQLEVYTVYRIPAAKFASCSDTTCANLCRSGGCEELRCSQQEDVTCNFHEM